MGSEINRSVFTEEDFIEFKKRLRQETKILMGWCRDGLLDKTSGICGLELEAWLVDQKSQPNPCSEQFLFQVNNDMVVPELSRFNFELNSVPRQLDGNVFSKIHEELKKTWSRCSKAGENIGAQTVAIGSLPTITHPQLTLEYMSPHQRFYALNEQILRVRKGEPLQINIEGEEELHSIHQDIMLEAAATSLQIHLQVNLETAPRYYNASQIITAPMVAVAANSPYLFGKRLWEETRIKVFEEAVAVASFRDVHGENVGRVTFGSGYIRNSIIEPFLENLDGYPVLLPFTTNSDPQWLNHLRLQNGTIWRWNRPLVGLDLEGKPHIRIEHRVMSSPPSLTDTVANMAFYLGAVHVFAERPVAPETEMSFEDAKKNFYIAAKSGLNAEIKWFGKNISLKALILDELIPAAKDKLIEKGLDKEEVEYYLDDVLRKRVESGQTGAQWQKAFIDAHGPHFDQMTQAYIDQQKQDLPVYKWKI